MSWTIDTIPRPWCTRCSSYHPTSSPHFGRLGLRDQSGLRLDWTRPPLSDLLADEGLTITAYLWHNPFDPFKPSAPWWQWREPCDCPDTSFGRNPHRWNCTLTPIWAQTIRDLDTNPWTVCKIPPHVGLQFAPFLWGGEVGAHCGRGPCCLGDGHDGRCRM